MHLSFIVIQSLQRRLHCVLYLLHVTLSLAAFIPCVCSCERTTSGHLRPFVQLIKRL